MLIILPEVFEKVADENPSAFRESISISISGCMAPRRSRMMQSEKKGGRGEGKKDFAIFCFILTTLNKKKKTIRTVLSRKHDLSEPVFKNPRRYSLFSHDVIKN